MSSDKDTKDNHLWTQTWNYHREYEASLPSGAFPIVATKQLCECGSHKTFGEDCPPNFHSYWCPLYKDKLV